MKSKKYVLLGYGSTSKGYRLHTILLKKVFHSRDVIFSEQKYGFNKLSESQKEPEEQVVLE